MGKQLWYEYTYGTIKKFKKQSSMALKELKLLSDTGVFIDLFHEKILPEDEVQAPRKSLSSQPKPKPSYFGKTPIWPPLLAVELPIPIQGLLTFPPLLVQQLPSERQVEESLESAFDSAGSWIRDSTAGDLKIATSNYRGISSLLKYHPEIDRELFDLFDEFLEDLWLFQVHDRAKKKSKYSSYHCLFCWKPPHKGQISTHKYCQDHKPGKIIKGKKNWSGYRDGKRVLERAFKKLKLKPPFKPHKVWAAVRKHPDNLVWSEQYIPTLNKLEEHLGFINSNHFPNHGNTSTLSDFSNLNWKIQAKIVAEFIGCLPRVNKIIGNLEPKKNSTRDAWIVRVAKALQHPLDQELKLIPGLNTPFCVKIIAEFIHYENYLLLKELGAGSVITKEKIYLPDQVKKLKAKGLTFQEIGKELGFTRQRAQYIHKQSST